MGAMEMEMEMEMGHDFMCQCYGAKRESLDTNR